jgi:disulfide bond formation protein DsbB
MTLFSSTTPATSALSIAALAALTLAGAWAFQYAGYPPCDLCYVQRYAYYAAVPVGLAIALASAVKAPRAVLGVGFALLAAMFVYNSGLAIYHSGVEAKLWAGPTACTGGYAGGQGDLLTQLQTIKVVRCDKVSLRVFGLSLANWNIFISAALAALGAASVLRRQ